MKKCKYCGEEKALDCFVNQKINEIVVYRSRCKECKNKLRRKGTISNTRFKPGGHPGKEFQKGHIPWYKIKGIPHPRKDKIDKENKNRFTSYSYKEWREKVLKRDGYKCQFCGSSEKLHVHHLIPWFENDELRFDEKNGSVVCSSCHGKIEGFMTGMEPWNKT